MKYLKNYFVIFASLLLVSTATIVSCQTENAESKENPNIFKPLEPLKFGDPLPGNLFVELAKHINPTVVNISVMSRPQQAMIPQGRNRDPFWDFFEQFMGPQQGRPRQPQQAQATGTGFIIESDGLIVTNNHVVDDADIIKVQLVNDPDNLYDAEVVGKDARTDVALIKIKVSGKLPVAELGSSADVQVGEWVAAFGNPYGHTFSVSKGIISAKSRSIRDLNAVPFLQTDASINPGNSGGPLVNTKGKVIGVNSAIDARAQGIGFAIPIDHVKSIIPQLKDKGKIIYGYIGVEGDYVSPRAQQALNLKSADGSLVMGVLENGPAAKAGIQTYDVITQFNGKEIKDPKDLSDAVKDTPIGKSAKAVLFRNGKKMELNITVAEPPTERVAARRGPVTPRPEGNSAPHQLGFKVADYSEKLAEQFEFKNDAPKGPVVIDVDPNGPAARNGLRPGDIILDVNKTKVAKAKDVTKAIVNGVNIFRVYQGGRVSLVFLDVE